MALVGPEGETVSHIDRRHGQGGQTVQPIKRKLPDKGTWVGPKDVGEPVPEASKRYLEALAAKAHALSGSPIVGSPADAPNLAALHDMESMLTEASAARPLTIVTSPPTKLVEMRSAAARALADLIEHYPFSTALERRILIQALGVVGTLP